MSRRPYRFTFPCVLAATLALPASVATPADASDPPAKAPAEPLPHDPDHQDLLPYGRRGGQRSAIAVRLVPGGLRWLQSKQAPDGSFGPGEAQGVGEPMRPGIAGLTVLAFLAAGVHPEGTDEPAACVRRALDYLGTVPDTSDAMQSPTSQVETYAHAFRTTALVEAAAVTGDRERIRRAQRALDVIYPWRRQYWAWGYGLKGTAQNTSVTGAMAGAHIAAAIANQAAKRCQMQPMFRVDDDATEGLRGWVDMMTSTETGFVGYEKRGAPQAWQGNTLLATTAIGAYTYRVFWSDFGKDESEEPRHSRVLDAVPSASDPDIYGWYWGALAVGSPSSPRAAAWRRGLEAALDTLARPEGDGVHWPAPSPWTEAAGRVCRTALAVLALSAAEGAHRRDYRAREETVRTAALAGTATSATRGRALATGLRLQLKGVEDAVGPALADGDVALRRAVARSLRFVSNPVTRAAATKTALLDADEIVAETAARSVVWAPAVDPTILVHGLGHASPLVRTTALDLAADLGAAPAVAEAARTLLGDTQLPVRVSAATLFATARADDPRLVPTLIEGVAAAATETRHRALVGLSHAPRDAQAALAPLETLARDGSPADQIEAVIALACLRRADSDIAAVLTGLDSMDREVCRRAALGLSRIGSLLTPHVRTIASHLNSYREVRLGVARFLRSLGTDARLAIPALETALLDGPSFSLNAALEETAAALKDVALLHPPTAKVAALTDLSAIRAALSDPASERAAAPGLLRAGSAAHPALLALARGTDSPLRIRAIDWLGLADRAMREPAAPLLEAAASTDSNVAAAGLRAIARRVQVGSSGFAVALRRGTDEDPWVRSAALSVITRGTTSPEAIRACGRCFEATTGDRGWVFVADAVRAAEALGRWRVRTSDSAWNGLASLLASWQLPDEGSRRIFAAVSPVLSADGPVLNALLTHYRDIAFADRSAAEAVFRAAAGRDAKVTAVIANHWVDAHAKEDATPPLDVLIVVGAPVIEPLFRAAARNERAARRAVALVGKEMASDLAKQANAVCRASIDLPEEALVGLYRHFDNAPGGWEALVRCFKGPPDVVAGAARIVALASKVENWKPDLVAAINEARRRHTTGVAAEWVKRAHDRLR